MEGERGTTAAGVESRHVWVVAAVVSLLTPACAAPAGERPEKQSAGVPTLELVTRIGCGECDGLQQLAPASVDATADRVIVRDRFEPLVRIFDLRGELLHSFGHLGQGPGEIELDFLPAYVASDGQIYQYGMAGLQEFSPKGEFMATHPWPMRMPISQHFEPGHGRLYVLSFVLGGTRSTELLAYSPREAQFGPVVAVSADALPYADTDPERTLAREVAVAPDGRILLGDPESYVLYWYSVGGTPLTTFGRDVPRPAISPSKIRRLEQARQQSGSSEPIPTTQRHIAPQGLRFDGAGRLWVETLRWSEVGDEAQTTTFDVFDSDDEFLGEVMLDVTFLKRYPALVVRGDLLVGAYSDPDDGEARVGIWRIIER